VPTLAQTLLAATAKALPRPSPDLSTAASALGEEGNRELMQVPPERRLLLTDQFVRNLRSLPMDRAVELEHALLPAVDAAPPETWRIALGGPQSLVALRTQIKLSLTALGLPWSVILRLQSCMCMLAGWIDESGGGTVELTTTRSSMRFRLTTQALGGDAAMLRDSPMVGTLQEHVPDLVTNSDGSEIVLQFSLRAPEEAR
jgi:hypothetical protein